MAISRLASAPKGGRPTRRIARRCAGDTSGMSEKSIPRRRRIGRPLFAARPARADDADPFTMVSPPHGIGHDEHAIRRRAAQSQESRLLVGVTQVWAVQGIRIAEHGLRFFERDPVLGAVDRGLPRVPLEHGSVYTKLEAADLPVPSTYPSDRLPPLSGGIRDGAHPRVGPPPPCPDSAAARSVAWARPWPMTSVSGSRCSSRRTSTGPPEPASRS